VDPQTALKEHTLVIGVFQEKRQGVHTDEGFAEGGGNGGLEQEYGHDERSHIFGCLREGIFQSSNRCEDFTQSYQNVSGYTYQYKRHDRQLNGIGCLRSCLNPDGETRGEGIAIRICACGCLIMARVGLFDDQSDKSREQPEGECTL
jgi:hypothetical protein